jgi:precorrin-6B methylase 1
MSFRVTGISVESAIISNLLSMAPDFHVIPNPSAVQCYAAQLRWPSKAGILISQNGPTNVISEFKVFI